MADRSFHQCAHLRRQRREAVCGKVLVQGNRIARVTRANGSQFAAGCRGQRYRCSRRDSDARHGRGSYAFLVERPAVSRLDPAHADRGAHPVVRAYRRALSVDGLDLMRRRGDRQAATRRRHSQCDQRRRDSGAALHRREPGDHRAGRPRRQHAAASAAARVQFRRRRQRTRGGSALRAAVRQVRRRPDQDQSVGRVHHRTAGRVHAVFGRRDRDVRDRGQALRQARRRARAFVRIGQAVHPAWNRSHLSRELRRRRSARSARSQQGQALRRTRDSRGSSTPRTTRPNGD